MFLQHIINGVALGCTYALMSLSYGLTFGVLKIVNLAYGEIFMVASYAALCGCWALGDNAITAFVCGIAAAIALGLAIHEVAVRPMGNVSDVASPRHLRVLISTLGCSLILQNLALMAFGGYPQSFPRVFGAPSTAHSNLLPEASYIAAAILALGLMMALRYVQVSTHLGIRLRALADNRSLAGLCGLPVTRDERICVALSSGLVGVCGVLVSDIVGGISPLGGALYGLKGLIVLIVAGSGNMIAAVGCGVGLGVVEVVASGYLSSAYRDCVAYGTLLVALRVVPRYGVRSMTKW